MGFCSSPGSCGLLQTAPLQCCYRTLVRLSWASQLLFSVVPGVVQQLGWPWCFLSMLAAERMSSDFHYAFSTGLGSHKIQTCRAVVSLGLLCPAGRPLPRWLPLCGSSQTPQRVSSVLGVKLLWLVVVGATAVPTQSLLSLGITVWVPPCLCKGGKNTGKGTPLSILWLKFTVL